MLGCVPLLKTLLFTIVVPGTVVVLVPRWLMRGEGALHGGWLGAAGALLLICGAALYLRCAWDFAMRGRGTPAPIDPPRELVVAGVYRYVRNPMYIGVLSMLVGEAVLYRADVLLGYAAALFLAFHLFVVAYEEPTLRRKFGASHERYCASVPRWLPRLRPWNG
jgi:protein-S-isoprenylcysteine O-methyltransferase Ste14